MCYDLVTPKKCLHVFKIKMYWNVCVSSILIETRWKPLKCPARGIYAFIVAHSGNVILQRNEWATTIGSNMNDSHR